MQAPISVYENQIIGTGGKAVRRRMEGAESTARCPLQGSSVRKGTEEKDCHPIMCEGTCHSLSYSCYEIGNKFILSELSACFIIFVF